MSCCRIAVQPLGRHMAASASAVAAAPALVPFRGMSTSAAGGNGRAAERERETNRRGNARARPRDATNADSPRRSYPRGPAVPPKGLSQLLSSFATLKAEGRKPTAAAYNALIKESADYAQRRGKNVTDAGGATASADGAKYSLGLEIALGAIRDAEAGGIELGVDALDQLLRFTLLHPEILPSVLIEFARRGQSSTQTYTTLANAAIAGGRLEELVMIMHEMFEQNMAPRQSTLRHAIRLCCEWGNSRLAMQILQHLETMPQYTKALAESWVQILMAGADQQDLEAVEEAWDRVVTNRSYTPDEGLILSVLAVAARHGQPNLANRALSLLPDIGVVAKEHHLGPLIEAFCRGGRVPEAIAAVALIRAAGIEPSRMTVRAIVDVLTNAEVIDQAFYTLEDLHKEGKVVDIVVFNAVIDASGRIGDLQRARATQLAAPELGVTPNIDTYNLVLDACVVARHRDLAKTVLSELATAGLQPSEATYDALIRLACSSRDYEDAFYYLEKMKASGLKPSRAVYKRIGMKCAMNNDKRYTLVEDEMEALGYSRPNFATEAERRNERRRVGRERDAARNARSGQRTGARPQRTQTQSQSQ